MRVLARKIHDASKKEPHRMIRMIRMIRMPRTPLGFIAAPAFAAALFVSGDAAAQQKGGVITINEVTIVGRVQKPVASVDVSKIQPKLTLAELRQPFLDRIEEAARKDPF